jgi:hypothetical protein
MIDLDIIYQYLESSDGVNQQQRKLPALDPTSVQLDGRSKYDIISFLFQLSKQLSFYNQTNTAQGDLSGFFNFLRASDGSIMSDDQLNQLMATRNDWPPHLTLLMTFLSLYAFAQQDINQLVAKHLDYYYKDILQLSPRNAQHDQVLVTFELNKAATSFLLRQNTLLDAGKDSTGQPLRYAIDNDLIINKAVVQSLRSLYFDQQNGHAIAFVANDATLVNSSLSSGWRPFGTAQLPLAPEDRSMIEANLGFAISSPSLLLAEGTRTITLTIYISAANTAIDNLPACFTAAITGDKGWITPQFTEAFQLTTTIDPTTSQPVSTGTLTVKATLLSTDAPVVAYSAAVHGDGYSTGWPVIRCMLQPYSYQLESLDSFSVTGVDIAVCAAGLKNLVLQNDESLQPTNKPIVPFTSFPRIGNNFYVGSTEAFSKNLQSLSVTLTWKDPPADFAAYYAGYDNPQINYSDFLYSASILAAGSFQTVTTGAQTLFDGSNTSNPKIITEDATLFGSLGYAPNPNLTPVSEYTPGLNQGFMAIQLTAPKQADVGNLPAYAPFDAFGHKVFPQIYTVKAVKLTTDPSTVLPNQPYTPTLQSVTLSYSAKASFTPGLPGNTDQFFILDAFGNAACNPNVSARLIPEFPVPIASITGQKSGSLFIGVGQTQLPQILSLLFQMESGSMPGSVLLQKENIAWSYLKDNAWLPVAALDIQRDTTGSFQKPGIIQLSAASDADTAATIMPAGLYWLRVTAQKNADGASDISALVSQAASATRIVNENAVISTLPPGTITKLATKVSAIKTITQSYPSFNGLPAETDTDFYVRTSERLRHRNRPVAGWDYERIVLREFPGLFKAKCLSYTDFIDDFNNLKPGSIKLVVIPDVRQGNAGNPLQPISNLAYLDEIKQFVVTANPSPFLTANTVYVSNPVYETLLVDCKVSFVTGFDPAYYSNQLQDDIRRFLSPWAYDEGQDITFGGKIYASELLSFIEGRPYVDYVINFQLYHRSQEKDFTSGIGCMTIGVDFIVGIQPAATIASAGGVPFAGTTIGVDFVVGIPVDVATTTRPDAILASNTSHRIGTLQADGFECSGVTALGIGEMIVGLDFIPL